MPTTKGTRMVYRCSFCDKSQGQVKRLIAGPGGVYICNECVELCRGIIEEEQSSQPPESESVTARREYPGSVQAFFAGLPSASDPVEDDTLYPAVQIEFMGRFAQSRRVFLLGRDSTGIVVRDREADGGIHFYPWSSIFSLTP